MTTYLVTFEVANSAAREKLIAKLRTFPGYCPIHANCWAVSSNQTAMQVCDALKSEVFAQDRVFVIRSGTEAAWVNAYGEEHSKWLKNNL